MYKTNKIKRKCQACINIVISSGSRSIKSNKVHKMQIKRAYEVRAAVQFKVYMDKKSTEELWNWNIAFKCTLPLERSHSTSEPRRHWWRIGNKHSGFLCSWSVFLKIINLTDTRFVADAKFRLVHGQFKFWTREENQWLSNFPKKIVTLPNLWWFFKKSHLHENYLWIYTKTNQPTKQNPIKIGYYLSLLNVKCTLSKSLSQGGI